MEPPSWMVSGFDVWYRNPHDVIKNILANTDFNGEMDAAPFREYNANGQRQYHNFMSGDWAWAQAVSPLHALKCTYYILHQDLIAETLTRMGQCLYPSSSAATKRLSRLAPATLDTIRFTLPSEILITAFVVLIEMHLFSSRSLPSRKVCFVYYFVVPSTHL